ncbi:MAG: hypothetical protein ACFN04_04430, partial [Propionibacterium acidifaciens]
MGQPYRRAPVGPRRVPAGASARPGPPGGSAERERPDRAVPGADARYTLVHGVDGAVFKIDSRAE